MIWKTSRKYMKHVDKDGPLVEGLQYPINPVNVLIPFHPDESRKPPKKMNLVVELCNVLPVPVSFLK